MGKEDVKIVRENQDKERVWGFSFLSDLGEHPLEKDGEKFVSWMRKLTELLW